MNVPPPMPHAPPMPPPPLNQDRFEDYPCVKRGEIYGRTKGPYDGNQAYDEILYRRPDGSVQATYWLSNEYENADGQPECPGGPIPRLVRQNAAPLGGGKRRKTRRHRKQRKQSRRHRRRV